MENILPRNVWCQLQLCLDRAFVYKPSKAASTVQNQSLAQRSMHFHASLLIF